MTKLKKSVKTRNDLKCKDLARKLKKMLYFFLNFVDSMDFLKGLVHLWIDWIRMKLLRICTAFSYKDIYVAFISNE